MFHGGVDILDTTARFLLLRQVEEKGATCDISSTKLHKFDWFNGPEVDIVLPYLAGQSLQLHDVDPQLLMRLPSIDSDEDTKSEFILRLGRLDEYRRSMWLAHLFERRGRGEVYFYHDPSNNGRLAYDQIIFINNLFKRFRLPHMPPEVVNLIVLTITKPAGWNPFFGDKEIYKKVFNKEQEQLTDERFINTVYGELAPFRIGSGLINKYQCIDSWVNMPVTTRVQQLQIRFACSFFPEDHIDARHQIFGDQGHSGHTCRKINLINWAMEHFKRLSSQEIKNDWYKVLIDALFGLGVTELLPSLEDKIIELINQDPNATQILGAPLDLFRQRVIEIETTDPITQTTNLGLTLASSASTASDESDSDEDDNKSRLSRRF